MIRHAGCPNKYVSATIMLGFDWELHIPKTIIVSPQDVYAVRRGRTKNISRKVVDL